MHGRVASLMSMSGGVPLQVRNNEKQHAGKILADERRVNVALTRAKLKLVMLGAQRTLCSVPVMQRLWEFCSEKGWTLPVPSES